MTAQVNEPATGLEKRCAECDESTSAVEKRCPSGCGSKKKKTPPPKREEEGTLKESSMMKRFLNALPDEDRRLIEVAVTFSIRGCSLGVRVRAGDSAQSYRKR